MSSRFAFGRNWEQFLQGLNEERISEAESELRDRFGVETFKGKTFLDIGCGSGLFSLAAFRLGADRVVSFDYDEDSVYCCHRLQAEYGDETWSVMQGDLLDSEFMQSFETFDFVYCWGVAHHTGSMWTATANAAECVKEGGKLCLGLYHECEDGLWNSYRAHTVKRLFVSSPSPLQYVMALSWGVAVLVYRAVTLREDPRAHIREYESDRGMDFWTDVHDWVGGYPFEFASPERVENYFEDQFPAFELVTIETPANSPSAVDTYVFMNRGN